MAKSPVAVVKDDTDKTSTTAKNKTKTTSSDTLTSLLEEEVAVALKSNDPLEISKIQLKLLLSIANNLNKIDWKLWEFYTRLGKQ